MFKEFVYIICFDKSVNIYLVKNMTYLNRILNITGYDGYA